jgi:hypothetical protein
MPNWHGTPWFWMESTAAFGRRVWDVKKFALSMQTTPKIPSGGNIIFSPIAGVMAHISGNCNNIFGTKSFLVFTVAFFVKLNLKRYPSIRHNFKELLLRF